MSDKIYVTLKGDYKYDVSGQILIGYLGFAAGYIPGKTDAKNQTQRDWAYPIYTYEFDEGSIYELTRRNEYVDGKYNRDIIARTPVPNLNPKILDNVPLTGFKIAGYAQRWSTSNKLFRIEDPRGFQLEISVQNFIELAQQVVIDKGEFIAPLKWDFGKKGIGKAKLVLCS